MDAVISVSNPPPFGSRHPSPCAIPSGPSAPFGYLITWITNQPILIHMRGEKVLRVTISLINGHMGLMDLTHSFAPADGGKARVHGFSATSLDLARSDAAFGPDVPDRNWRGETTQGSEEVTLSSEGATDLGNFSRYRPHITPTICRTAIRQGSLLCTVSPRTPSPSDFGPQTIQSVLWLRPFVARLRVLHFVVPFSRRCRSLTHTISCTPVVLFYAVDN